jgi:hypothetical protein
MITPELPREVRIRRAMVCCCAIIRNVAYYQGGWREGQRLFDSNIERTISGNFIDMAVLEWCKLFGESRHEPQHWQRVLLGIEQRRSFKGGLLKSLNQSSIQWNKHCESCIRYRSDFIAHLGSEHRMHLPFVDPLRKSAAFYYEFLQMSEMTDANPADIEQFYESCAASGREYYSSHA